MWGCETSDGQGLWHGAGLPPISWADLEVAALKLANRSLWLDIKTQRASIAAGGSTIAENFGSPWDVRNPISPFMHMLVYLQQIMWQLRSRHPDVVTACLLCYFASCVISSERGENV